MITTVTINPAVDHTVETSKLELGTVNQVASVRKDAAGKGINVAKDVTKLGKEARAIACLGGASGEYIVNCLEEKGILSEISWTEEETRVNLKVVDKSGSQTKINQLGPDISSVVLEKTKQNIIKAANDSEIIVLAGSLPPSLPQNFYQTLISQLGQEETKVFLDTSGQPLKLALEANPTLIKPNIHELEEIYGKELSLDGVIDIGQELVTEGIELVLVSMGAKGAVLITEEEVIRAIPPQVDPVSTVGAGDSLVAGMASSYMDDRPPEEMLRFAIAVSVATILQPGTETGELSEVKKWSDEVKIDKEDT
ncbi:1-phosphofructokinase [Halanaerobaculum tunisiense]